MRGDLLEFHLGGVRLGATVLAWTACHFGAGRVWFVCPGCERRCRKLHFTFSLHPRCRTCADLRYQSQLEDELLRGLRWARRIRRQLGGDEALVARFPRKPPGMRWKRYDALREEALAAERAWLEAQQEFAPRLMQRRQSPYPPSWQARRPQPPAVSTGRC